VTTRLLLFPHNLRYKFYHHLMATVKAETDWDIAVVAPDNQYRAWADIVPREKLFVPPEFSSKMVFEITPEIISFITTAERLTGIPLHRIALSAERDIGRSYGRPLYHWPDTALSKRAESDIRAPERIIAQMLAHALDLIRSYKPHVIVAGNLASPETFVAYFVAKYLGIPFVINRASKVWSGHCYWTTRFDMLNESGKETFTKLSVEAASPTQSATDKLESFRNQPQTISYIQKNWDLASATNWLGTHRRFAQLLKAQLAYFVKGKKGVAPKPVLSTISQFYAGEFRAWRQKKHFKSLSNKELADLKYIYFPMHKEPELAINHQAPAWHDQLNTATQISMNLPYGYRLLVREHRLNRGRRSMEYIQTLISLPGTILIDALDPQFKYISNADLIITENGSSGWEGIQFGKPVITLAESFYAPSGLTNHLEKPAELGATILDALQDGHSSVAHDADEHIRLLMDAEYQSSHLDDGTDNQSLLAELADLITMDGDMMASGKDT
jgi:hypothetical protein